MRTNLVVRWIFGMAASVPHRCSNYSRHLIEVILHSPKASSREYRLLCVHKLIVTGVSILFNSLQHLSICYSRHMLLSADVEHKTISNKLLFDGLAITVEDGEKLAIIGRNGVGKTTLFRMLTGED